MAKPKKPIVGKWTPFIEIKVEESVQRLAIQPILQIFRNSLYEVFVRLVDGGLFGEVRHLSIKRLDRGIMRDWRDLQRIKNEICGPEVEACELFPAESRLVDTSNQYHLFCLPLGARFPFGYDDRLVGETTVGAARQRPFPADAKPSDLQDVPDLIRRYRDKQK